MATRNKATKNKKVESTTLRRSWYAGRLCILLSIGWLLLGSICACNSQNAITSAESAVAKARRTASSLFEIAAERKYEQLPDRMKAAGQLAELRGAEGWIVLLLLHNSPVRPLPTDEDERLRMVAKRPFELAVVVALIRNLPRTVPMPIQWAVTEFLTEETIAKWSTKSYRFGGLIVVRGQATSPPVREVARCFLRESLGVDHAWDVEAWRQAILKKSIEGRSAGSGDVVSTAQRSSADP